MKMPRPPCVPFSAPFGLGRKLPARAHPLSEAMAFIVPDIAAS